MNDEERSADGMRTRREVLGDAHVDRAVAGTTEFTAPFQDFITRYAWGEIWNRPGLSRPERSMITLAMLATLGRDEELAMHVRAARRNGLTQAQIAEVLLQVAVYAGVPAANRAFTVARDSPRRPFVDRTTVHSSGRCVYRFGKSLEEDWPEVAEIVTLAEAIAAAVHDGDTVAMEGFTHLIPHAAGHEVIRQGRRDLTLVRMTPDIIYDQLIGAGCARKLIFSWAGNPGVGSLHRFRDAVENGWPGPLELEEHSHAGMANRYQAGASGLPFAILRGYRGTSLGEHTAGIADITCPFTGETLTAVSALRPDVTVIHAQRADRQGNVQFWGITGVQKEAVLAAARSVVTVEEIVGSLEPKPGAVVLPAWTVNYVAAVPGGAHPSYALGYSARDNAFYLAWDEISRDREKFSAWLSEHVYGQAATDGVQ